MGAVRETDRARRDHALCRGVGHAGDYDELWHWSVDDLEGFWAAIWEFFDVQASEPYERVLGRREMPGAQWFPGRG